MEHEKQTVTVIRCFSMFLCVKLYVVVVSIIYMHCSIVFVELSHHLHQTFACAPCVWWLELAHRAEPTGLWHSKQHMSMINYVFSINCATFFSSLDFPFVSSRHVLLLISFFFLSFSQTKDILFWHQRCSSLLRLFMGCFSLWFVHLVHWFLLIERMLVDWWMVDIPSWFCKQLYFTLVWPTTNFSFVSFLSTICLRFATNFVLPISWRSMSEAGSETWCINCGEQVFESDHGYPYRCVRRKVSVLCLCLFVCLFVCFFHVSFPLLLLPLTAISLFVPSAASLAFSWNTCCEFDSPALSLSACFFVRPALNVFCVCVFVAKPANAHWWW